MRLMSTRAIDDAQPAHLANMPMRSEGSDIGLRSSEAGPTTINGRDAGHRLRLNEPKYGYLFRDTARQIRKEIDRR